MHRGKKEKSSLIYRFFTENSFRQGDRIAGRSEKSPWLETSNGTRFLENDFSSTNFLIFMYLGDVAFIIFRLSTVAYFSAPFFSTRNGGCCVDMTIIFDILAVRIEF